MKPITIKDQIEMIRRKGELLRQTAIFLNAIQNGEIKGIELPLENTIQKFQDTEFELTELNDICLCFMDMNVEWEQPILRQPKPESDGGVCELWLDFGSGMGCDVAVIRESNQNEIDPELNATIAEIIAKCQD